VAITGVDGVAVKAISK